MKHLSAPPPLSVVKVSFLQDSSTTSLLKSGITSQLLSDAPNYADLT